MPPSADLTTDYRLALTIDELADATVELRTRTPAGRRSTASMRKAACWTGVIGVVCLGAWVYKAAGNGWEWVFDGLLMLALFMCALATLLYRSALPGVIRKAALRGAHNPAYAGLLHEHSVRLSAEGFFLECRDSTAFNRWRLYEGVEVTERFLIFPMADSRVNVLPVRLMGGAAGAGAVAERCRGWIAADGGGEQRSVVAYLAAHDTECPKCKYQLRDLPRAQCPECGTVLGRENLPQAFVG